MAESRSTGPTEAILPGHGMGGRWTSSCGRSIVWIDALARTTDRLPLFSGASLDRAIFSGLVAENPICQLIPQEPRGTVSLEERVRRIGLAVDGGKAPRWALLQRRVESTHVDEEVVMGFTPSPSISVAIANLGLLGELPGHWIGHGFNLIARPDEQNHEPFFLELNSTKETLDFRAIGGDIPNRGSQSGDIELHGLHYLQQVSDRTTDTGIHIEPGLWIHVPPTTAPPVAADNYVRQATIPHGDSLLAQSTFATSVNTGPTIEPVFSTPFRGAIPGLDAPAANPVGPPQDPPAYLNQFVNSPLPADLPAGLNAAATIKDPTEILRAENAAQAADGHTITSTVVIAISTVPVGGIVNIPFVVQNANAVQMDAIFWIEKLQHRIFGEIMQLQYVQRVILSFIGIEWPHISVATLRKE